MAIAWQLPLMATEKLVLLALADSADDEGLCAASVQLLGEKTGVGKRALQYALRSLIRRGAMSVQLRYKQPSVYRIHLELFTDSLSGAFNAPQNASGALNAPQTFSGAPDAPQNFAPHGLGVRSGASHKQWGASGAPENDIKASSLPLLLRSKIQRREREHARPTGECRSGAFNAPQTVPREDDPEVAYASLLEDWRRDVPEANAAAFTRWVVYRESQGVQLGATQRLFQARRLSKLGDNEIQAEIVEWCMGHGYKSFIPIGDIRVRQAGFTAKAEKKPWMAQE